MITDDVVEVVSEAAKTGEGEGSVDENKLVSAAVVQALLIDDIDLSEDEKTDDDHAVENNGLTGRSADQSLVIEEAQDQEAAEDQQEPRPLAASARASQTPRNADYSILTRIRQQMWNLSDSRPLTPVTNPAQSPVAAIAQASAEQEATAQRQAGNVANTQRYRFTLAASRRGAVEPPAETVEVGLSSPSASPAPAGCGCVMS